MNRVFVYHTISEPLEAMPSNIDVSASLFEQHLNWLSRSGGVVELREQLEETSTSGTSAITFDDGFRDNLTVALPILEKYRFPMTLFAVADFIGTGDYLSTEELRILADHPLITIGSHALTHRHLSRMSDSEASSELSESKQKLESITGRTVDLLAYPYGDCSAATERIAEECGYAAAWSVWNGTNSRFSKWRIPLGRNDSLLRFIAKASAGYFPVKKFLRPPEVLA